MYGAEELPMTALYPLFSSMTTSTWGCESTAVVLPSQKTAVVPPAMASTPSTPAIRSRTRLLKLPPPDLNQRDDRWSSRAAADDGAPQPQQDYSTAYIL